VKQNLPSFSLCRGSVFVTDDYGEFEAMYSFAKSRIEKIYAELCFLKFTDDED